MRVFVNFKRMFPRVLHLMPIAAGMFALVGNLPAGTQSSSNAYLVTQWQTSDGLPENLVNSLVQTHDGYLWVGTFGGLARFDGLRFVTFGVHNSDAFVNNRIHDLIEDRTGDLWICCEGGFIRFHDGQFTRYTGQQGLRSDDVRGVAEDNLGNLWVGGNGGLDRWQDGRFVVDECGRQLGNQGVRTIHSGSSGRVWITTSQGLYLIENGILAPYRIPESAGPLGDVSNAKEDNTGHLWILGSKFTTRFALDKLLREKAIAEPIFRNQAGPFCVCSNGDFWFSTSEPGLYHWREGQGTNIDRIEGVSGVEIRTIYQDREGNVWVGTTTGGLNRVGQRTIEIRSVADGVSDQDTLTVAEDGAKRFWVGTYNGGLFSGAAGRFDRFAPEHGPYSSSSIWSVCPVSDGSLWVGTWQNGLFRIKDGVVSTFLSGSSVQSIYEDKDGSLWVGTYGSGLNHFDGRKFTTYGTEQGLDGKYLICVLRTRDGTLWVGSNGWGVYRLVDGKFIGYSKKAGLPSNVVLAIYQDKEGHVWVGTQGDGGLSCWCGDHFVSLTHQSGLPVDAVKEILEDDSGNLWLGSNRGIVRARKSELNDFVDGKMSWIHVATYGSKDGLSNIECRGATQPSACKASDGKLWFATHEGLVMIDPSCVSSNNQPPSVIIEDVAVDGHPVWSFDKTEVRPAPGGRPPAFDAQLLPSEQACEIRYTSPLLSAPEKVQFKYRMEGLDARWTEAGTQRTAVYKYLPPGKYRFQVIACNENGVWNQTGAFVTLYRPPPFWQAGWFMALAGLATALAIAGSVRWITKRRMQRRLEELKRQNLLERERTRIARDIHDDLGASLTKISKLSEIMDQRIGAQEENRSFAQTIAGTANEAIRAIEEIIWAVNPKNDTIEGVANYLVHFTEEFLRSARISCQLDVPLVLPDLPISAEIRHNLFMAVKEALNNAVKHASPTRVRLGLELAGNVLAVEVADDGQWVEKEGNRPLGTGLESMRKRLEAIGGEFQLSRKPGCGTIVRMKVGLDHEIARP
jgi:ligand-binding sensor domain-containing protein/signal transduction histidine kinase